MEVENKKSMSPILIVVLSVLGTCLVGGLVFLGIKSFKGKESDKPVEEPSSVIEAVPVNPTENSDNNSGTPSNQEQTTTPVEDNNGFPEKGKLKGEILNFPVGKNEAKILVSANDLSDNHISSDDNFKNVAFNSNGKRLVFNCEAYDDFCIKTKITVDDNTTLYYEEFDNLNIYTYGEYYILISEHDRVGGMTIFKNNTKVFESTEYSLYQLVIEDVTSGHGWFDVHPVVKDSKLYFVTFDKDPDNDGFFECKYQYIDLSSSTIKANAIQTFISVSENYFY